MNRTRGKREAASGGSLWQAAVSGLRRKRETSARPGKEPEQARTDRVKRGALIALGCTAALALVIAALWGIFVRPPAVDDGSQSGMDGSETGADRSGPGQKEDGAPEGAELGNGRKENYFTFILLGKDTSSGSTDTMLLVSYDAKNQTVDCMSLPRDTMVNVSWDIKRINSVYSAKQSKGGGIEGLKTQVGMLTGVVPDFYVVIEWQAVGRLVEELGGVYFDVPYNMNYDDDIQNLHIHQSKGYRLLSGDDAMQVVRWRQNNDGSNYGDGVRIQVQQAFLKAVAKQCLQLGNLTKIQSFAKIFVENVEMDPALKIENILWLAQQAMGVDIDNVNFYSMPGNYEGWAWSRTYHSNQSYVFADPAELAELINQHFNPYNREIAQSDLQVMYKNRDGSLGVTNGTLADTKAASAPVRTSSSSGKTSSAPAADPGTDPNADPKTNSGTDPGADPNANPGTDPGADPNANPGTDPGTDPNANPGTDPGTDPNANPGTDPNADPNVNPGTDPGGDIPGPAEAQDPQTPAGPEEGVQGG